MAVAGGVGRDHTGGTALYKCSGQIQARSREHPNVKTTTNNLAELVAFTRALRWAYESPRAYGRPICMRYDSMYAAHIATGVWRAKKHKAMAEEARQEWTRLKRATGGRLWMAHVRGHSGHEWNDLADRLAERGRQGHVEATVEARYAG